MGKEHLSSEAGDKHRLSRLLEKLYRGAGAGKPPLGALPLFAAAGVGTLMMPDVTLADVIYSGPQNIVVNKGSNVYLNLNATSIIPTSFPTSLGDSTDELRLWIQPNSAILLIQAEAHVGPSLGYPSYVLLGRSPIYGSSIYNIPYADILPGTRQVIINPGGPLLRIGTAGTTTQGYFTASNPRGFIGMKIFPKGGTAPGPFHWAWVEVEVNIADETLTVLGWGFESEPDTAVRAGVVAPIPEPGSGTLTALGMLALGAAGIRRMRRKRKEEEAEAA